MDNKLKILVTGASGRVGYQVVKQLLNANKEYDLTLFDKKSKTSVKKLVPLKNKVKLIFGDIATFDSIIEKEVYSNQNIVIHLAAIIPPLAEDDPELANSVNVNGTQNLVNALEKYSPEAFLFYSSSISVYADRIKDPYIKVGDPIKANENYDEYTKTKIKAENLITNSKLDWSIFRLCGIMGDHKISRLMFYMPLKTPMEIATSSDAARAFVNGVIHRKLISKTIFNLGGGKKMQITYEDFLKKSFGIIGLGAIDFPKKSFADKNFHGGHYLDGDKLEEILHFRKDTLDTYFTEFAQKNSVLEKKLISALKKPIKYFLLKKSEPLKAFKNKDHSKMKIFFSD